MERKFAFTNLIIITRQNGNAALRGLVGADRSDPFWAHGFTARILVTRLKVKATREEGWKGVGQETRNEPEL